MTGELASASHLVMVMANASNWADLFDASERDALRLVVTEVKNAQAIIAEKDRRIEELKFALADAVNLRPSAILAAYTATLTGPLEARIAELEEQVKTAMADALKERGSAYAIVCDQLIARYVEVFPNYAWMDPNSAIDLMTAEIKTLRMELADREDA